MDAAERHELRCLVVRQLAAQEAFVDYLAARPDHTDRVGIERERLVRMILDFLAIDR